MESRIDMAQMLKRASQQNCAGNDHYPHGNLRGGNRTEQARVARSSAIAVADLQRVRNRGARQLPDRSQSEEHSCKQSGAQCK